MLTIEIFNSPDSTNLSIAWFDCFAVDEGLFLNYKDMKIQKGKCLEIDGIFYQSIKCAMRELGQGYKRVVERAASDEWSDYRFVPFRVAYTEKRCTKCGEMKLLREFSEQDVCRDGFKTECKECGKKYDKKWKQDNAEHVKKYRNLPEVKERENETRRERRKSSPAYKINRNMSRSIWGSLKGKKNGAHCEDLVGYTVEELIVHLESLFTEGMSWDNYGKGKYKWSLDHIIAKSKFNITSNTCQEFLDCWALDNLQPLWHVRNREKGNKPMHPKYLIKPEGLVY